MKQKFINAVERGDVVSVRFFISNEMMLDPRGTSCFEMIQFAEERLPNLYEKEDENTYSYVDEELNNDYLSKIKNELDFCFTKKLLMFYIEVAKIVLKDKAMEIASEEQKHSAIRSQSESSNNGGSTQHQTQGDTNTGAFNSFYKSKAFWPTIGALGIALLYSLFRSNNK